MSNQLTIIGDTLRAPETTGKLMLALGHDDPKDPQAKNDAKRYAASVLAEIEKSAGTKQDLTTCSPHSIVQSMIDAAKFRLMIDGRQLAHLVKYGNNATLQIGYRGFIAKIAEHYEDADINVFSVYAGDTVTISGGDGFDRYTHDRADPFAEGEGKFKGIVAALYYRKGSREFQKVITMTKREIMQIRKVAKQDYIWSAWFVEKAKAAAVKRICKLQFASLSVLQEMIAYDNRKHYDIEKPIEDTKPGSIVDNLNQSLEDDDDVIDQPPAADDDVIDVTHEDDAQEPVQEVIDAETGEITTEEAAPHEELSQEDLQGMAKRIASAIKHEDTEQGMSDLFEVDYFKDIEIIKGASKTAYDHLIGLRDDRLKDIRGGV